MKLKKFTAILLCFIMLLIFNSCDFSKQELNEEENLEPTQTLKIYALDRGNVTIVNAESAFKKLYPDVDVEIQKFSADDKEAYSQALQSALMSGQGPDLVMLRGWEFKDLYKVIANGEFTDLNILIENDPDFNEGDYVSGVMDSGVFEGNRYLMPVGYHIPVLLTSEETIYETDFDLSSKKDFFSFTDEITKFTQKDQRHIFGCRPVSIGYYLRCSGISYIDYNNKKPNVDTEEFKRVCENYKEIYQRDYKEPIETNYENTDFFHDARELREKKVLFSGIYAPYLMMELGNVRAVKGEASPIVFPIPDKDGEYSAILESSVVIPKYSKNKLNAYNYIKIMISQEYQSQWQNTQGLPVNKEALRKTVVSEATKDLDFPVDMIDGELSDEFIDDYVNMLSSAARCEVEINSIDDILMDCMTPYFENESSYETALTVLRNKLNLYLNE